MCLIFVAHGVRDDYPLVVAANRDEFHSRAASAATFWSDAPNVLAGRDLQAGGTWLGIDNRGRFSAITNYRGAERNDNAPSRGALVSDFLTGDSPPDEYLSGVAARGPEFNGFSLLAGASERFGCYSNHSPAPQLLAPGLYGLSNDLLDTPWPKLERGKAEIARQLERPDVDAMALLDLLEDDHVPVDGELPDTGVGLERERILAPMFIRSEIYGTRCSTVVLIHRSGSVRFIERSFDEQGNETGTVDHRFQTVVHTGTRANES